MTLPLVMHSLRREAIRAAAKYLVYSITGACLAYSISKRSHKSVLIIIIVSQLFRMIPGRA